MIYYALQNYETGQYVAYEHAPYEYFRTKHVPYLDEAKLFTARGVVERLRMAIQSLDDPSLKFPYRVRTVKETAVRELVDDL